MQNDRYVTALLGFLVLLDFVLVPWAFLYPELWFSTWHGAEVIDPQGFLARCGANWLAFLLIQAVALWRWKDEVWWLAVVSGVRLSDVFTDLTVTFVAQDVTLATQLLFPLMGLGNFLFGAVLLRSFLLRSQRDRSDPE